MVTAGSLPIPREVAVNTITGPRAGGVSLGPLSEGPCWHSPWASMVSPLQKKESSRQAQLFSSPKSVYPMNFLSKTQKHRAPFRSRVAEATKASGVRGSSLNTSMNIVLSPCCPPGGSTRKSSPELASGASGSKQQWQIWLQAEEWRFEKHTSTVRSTFPGEHQSFQGNMEPYASKRKAHIHLWEPDSASLGCTNRSHSGEAEELGSKSNEQRQVGGRCEPGQCCPVSWVAWGFSFKVLTAGLTQNVCWPRHSRNQKGNQRIEECLRDKATSSSCTGQQRGSMAAFPYFLSFFYISC